VITGVVHFTGGINSHFTLLYPLAILTAGVVESGRLALKVAVLSILLYSTLIVLETSGVLIYRGPEPFPYAGIDHVYQQLMVRILIFTFFAAASSYLADRCFYQNHQMQRLRLVVEFIFNNVSIALLAVGRDGKVLVANTAAQELFGMSGRDIQQRSFPDFFADRQVPDLEDDHQRGRVWKMVGQDGEVFPAAFEASLSRFPIPEAGDTFVEDRECFVVAIQDLTEMLRLQQQARESVRLKTAMDIASEVGHWIRNPLTALQLAIDFVNSTFAANSSSGESLSEDELAAVCGMCEVIAEETRQLREKMDDFLRCADRDHARFLDMMAEAETWAGRLATSPGEESNG
jgi:PAS domain S-box-containing protein